MTGYRFPRPSGRPAGPTIPPRPDLPPRSSLDETSGYTIHEEDGDPLDLDRDPTFEVRVPWWEWAEFQDAPGVEFAHRPRIAGGLTEAEARQMVERLNAATPTPEEGEAPNG
jgi:hypothetical protein